MNSITFGLILKLLTPKVKTRVACVAELPALFWRNEGTHLELTDGKRTYATVDQMCNSVLQNVVYFGFIGDHIGNLFESRAEAQDWAISEVRHLLSQEAA